MTFHHSPLVVITVILCTTICAQKELTYSIKEESEVGLFLANLKTDVARKFLISTSPEDRFELYDDTKQNLFRVESDSGKLFVTNRIDRESICKESELSTNDDQASWSGSYYEPGPSHTSESCRLHLTLSISQQHWINLIITIHDINDHEPYFPIGDMGERKPVYTINIPESPNSGYEIPLINARDPDWGPNSVRTYNLRGADLDEHTFTVAYKSPNSLNLIVFTELDAETKSLYVGELVACDGGQPKPKCGVQQLEVIITDLNDNKPIFEHMTYEVEASEDAAVNSTLVTVKANDADSGEHGRVVYRIAAPVSKIIIQHFLLDPNSGELRLMKRLDARENSRYTMNVIASDAGTPSLAGKSRIHVNVIDENDHDPWIEVRPIQGHQPHDQNATSPNQSSLHLLENQSIGTNFGLIIAGDNDLADNGRVSCLLDKPYREFSLEHANSANGREMYRFLSNVSFDREKIRGGKIKLAVECKDAGSPQRSTKTNLDLLIDDLNEFRPKFPPGANFHTLLEEGKPLNTEILQVEAIDEDAEDDIRYYLSREAESYFSIDTKTGMISTSAVIDRETTPEIKFSVHVSDRKEEANTFSLPTDTINVTIRILDINDNAPELRESRSFQVVENRPGYSDLLGQLAAVDLDNQENGTINYFLDSVESDGKTIGKDAFMIDREKGTLYSTGSLDREQHNRYELKITLRDLGRPHSLNTNETIFVNVLDENDNSPVWIKPAKTSAKLEFDRKAELYKHKPRLQATNDGDIIELGCMNITSPIYRGQRLMMLQAEDSDSPTNANFTFALLSVFVSQGSTYGALVSKATESNTAYFAIVPSTGELVIGPGPRGTGINQSGLAELYLRVSDNGNPPLYSTARLFIYFTGAQNHEGSLLGLFLSSGYLGIALIVVLVLIICLTSVCLIIAFITLRKRSRCCCACCYTEAETKQSRLIHDPNCSYVSQSDRNDSIMTDGLILDGQLSAVGKLFHTVKPCGSPRLESNSLLRWNPDGEPGTYYTGPPMYNIALVNGRPVVSSDQGMRSSQTESEASGMALLPMEMTCMSPNELAYRQYTLPPDHAPATTSGESALRMIGGDSVDGSLARSRAIHFQQMASPPPTVPAEHDCGSADSGQGASEDEPINIDSLKNNQRLMYPASTLQRRLDQLPFLGSPTLLAHPTSSHFTTGLTTFNSPSKSSATVDDRNKPSTASSILNDQPCWQRPLFSTMELSHRNALFDDYPATGRLVGSWRHTATLPQSGPHPQQQSGDTPVNLLTNRCEPVVDADQQ